MTGKSKIDIEIEREREDRLTEAFLRGERESAARRAIENRTNPGRDRLGDTEEYAQWLETLLVNEGKEVRKLPEFYDCYTCYRCNLFLCPHRWNEFNVYGACMADEKKKGSGDDGKTVQRP